MQLTSGTTDFSLIKMFSKCSMHKITRFENRKEACLEPEWNSVLQDQTTIHWGKWTHNKKTREFRAGCHDQKRDLVTFFFFFCFHHKIPKRSIWCFGFVDMISILNYSRTHSADHKPVEESTLHICLEIREFIFKLWWDWKGEMFFHSVTLCSIL